MLTCARLSMSPGGPGLGAWDSTWASISLMPVALTRRSLRSRVTALSFSSRWSMRSASQPDLGGHAFYANEKIPDADLF